MLLDGHSIAYRAFFALPVENFSTTTGQPTNAVYGFTAMLINALRDEQPSHIAVAFDVSRKTFRAERFAEYKAKRSETPVDFRGQVELIREVLTALRIPSLSLEGYEADDLIATLATAAEAEDYDVLIVTGDRDTFQLVTDRVTVLYAVRGVSELARMTPAAVFDRYGLTPAQYPDFAALRGDPSDNLPGIPGVGEKTAAKWVREFGSFDALVDRVDEVPGKAGDALRAHLSAVMTNRQLTELVRDVPLEVVTESLVWPGWDRDAVHAVFDTLQFRVLRDRLYQTLTAAEPEAEAGFEVTGQLLEPGEVAGWLAEHTAGGPRVGIAAAGTWGRGTGRLTGIGLAAADGAGAWVDPAALTPADDTALAEWLADPDRPKVMHDAKGPMLALAAHGWPLRGLVSDTALSAYLVLPGQRSFDLADLTLRFLRRELRAEEPAEAGQLSFDGGDESAQAQALVVRARAVIELAEALD
ncbi:MAG: 5'-3' exonuclease H3TH domain-containing protein, partial [Actinomycetes bacterium]